MKNRSFIQSVMEYYRSLKGLPTTPPTPYEVMNNDDLRELLVQATAAATNLEWVPWIPITDPVDLKYLGKSGEEANELGAILCRIIIQGWAGIDPKTKQPNRICLEDEIADNEANGELLKKKYNLDRARIESRKLEKMAFLEPLHEAAGRTSFS